MSGLPPSWMSVPRPAMLVAMVTPPKRPGLRDDVGFLLVVAGVQHLMQDLRLLEQRRKVLRFLDADRADQHRLAALVGFRDAGHDRLVLLFAVR